MERVPVSKVRKIFLSYPGFVPDTDGDLDIYYKSPLFGSNNRNTDLCININPGDTVQIYTRFEPDAVKEGYKQTYTLQSYITFEIDEYEGKDTIYCEEEWLHKICLDVLENDKILREKQRKEEIQKDFV